MITNRLKEYKKEQKIATQTDDKIWAILYKERNRYAYINNKQLKDLLDIDRVKITGKYDEVDFDGIKKRVWVDGIITLSGVELQALEAVEKPKDYLEEENDSD